LKRLVRGATVGGAAAAARAAVAAATPAEAERLLRTALADELGVEVLDGLLGLA